ARQQPPADAQHHRPVSLNQGLEGRLIGVGHEALEQPAVAVLIIRRHAHQLADVANYRSRLSPRHGQGSERRGLILLQVTAGRGGGASIISSILCGSLPDDPFASSRWQMRSHELPSKCTGWSITMLC